MPRKEKEEITSLRRITKKGLRELCKKNKLYQTPELNDVLYLHYQGFQDIECLEEYTGLKCLWLESNAISDIKGLENQKQLKCLFLHNNLIRKIENLESCRELDTLNLSNNHISRIENCGVDKLPVLTTLNLAHNYLKCMEDLQNLTECKQLSVLDLGNNRIEDILVVKIFAEMPELRVLVLTGNPVVSRIPQYRKTLTLECKELTYLDSRPVFPRDRACAEAWKRGGYEEERREHDRWNKAERKKIRDSVNATLRLRNRGGGDPQVDLLASSSDEDDGLTERSSAPLKEDLQNMSTEEINSEIIELMRLGDLVEYEQNEKCTKESVNNEQNNEIEDLKCNPCISNQTETLPENKLISANKCAEDTAAEENSEAVERYGKTYKQAYDNYLEYVKILMNQDHSPITTDQNKNNEDTAAENNDICENKMNINENYDNEISGPNLISTLNGDQTSSLTELTKEDKSNLELNKDSGEINFTDIENKDDASIAESVGRKIEDVTDSETELNQFGRVKHDLPLELQTSSDSTNLQFAPEKEFSSVKDEISISSIAYMEPNLSLNSQTNNLSMPSFMFPKIIEDNESQLASVSDVENDELEESPRKSHDDNCKPECLTIKEFISNYEQFLGTIDNRKSHEKKETNSEKWDKVDAEKSSNNVVDMDSNSTFKKIRFFVQDYPEVENEESNKLQIINRLLENPITKQISNKKALEELDEEMKHIQEEQTKWIKKVTDKCYSQRDRYNDDLEVINDELFVIKKDRNNESDKVGKEEFNDTNDEVDNAQPQDLRPVSKLIKIEEGLENDDSEVYEMASLVCEETPSEHIVKEEPSAIIKRNENYSKNESKEHNNYSQRESLVNMSEYFECEPDFSNNNLLNNSERLSDSDSIEEYFVARTGSPQKDQLTDFNTGISSTLENTPEEIRKCKLSELKSEKESKCNLSEKETKLQYDFAEIPSTSKTNLRKLNLSKNGRDLQNDAAEILSNLEVFSEEEKQCNTRSSKKEIEFQDDSAQIPSTSKACLGKLRKNSFSEKESVRQYDTKEVLSTLEDISEERQGNSSEKEIEIPSTSKACLEKQRKCDFSEKDRDLQHNVAKVPSILEATLEEDNKFYISKNENEPQYSRAAIPHTLETSSEKEQKCNLPIEKIYLQDDDPSSTFNVKGFDSITEDFEWIKSSILNLASSGMAEGSGDTQANDKYIYSTNPEIDKIHHDIDEDFHKDLTSLFINASLEYKMIESAEKYGDPEVDSPFDIEQRAQWYLKELENHLPSEMKELINNENKNWHRFSGDADEFRNSNNIDESPHIKRLHEILKSRNASPGVVDKNKVLLKLVLANKDHLLNHEKPEARELAKKILKDNGIEEPDTDSASIEVNLSNTSTEVFEEKFAI